MQDNKASIPKTLRRFITKNYHVCVMRIIDQAGVVHDRQLERDIDNWPTWNREMLYYLKLKNIPFELRVVIRAGLFIYWHVPQFVKDWYFKTIK